MNENFNDEENRDNQNRVSCPQKFFDLLDLAERYQIISMKRELTSDALETLAIRNNNVIFTVRVLAKCLKLLLKKTSIGAGDIWTRFWALVNNTEDPKEQLQGCVAFQERLAGTPSAHLTISHALIKETLEEMIIVTSASSWLAQGRVHVRCKT